MECVTLDFSYLFSIILTINNHTYNPSQILNSIINNQSLTFKEHVQIIILNMDNVLNKYDLETFIKSYPENIKVLDFNYGNESLKYLMDYIDGEYVGFIENNDILSSDALEDINSLLSKSEINVGCLLDKSLYETSIKDYLNDLKDEYNILQFEDMLFFIKYHLFHDILTKYSVNDYWSLVMMSFDVDSRYLISNNSYISKPIDESNIKQRVHTNEYYYDKMEHFFKNSYEYYLNKYSEIPEHVQKVFTYYLADLIENFDLNSLNDKNQDSFKKSLNYYISKMDYNTIVNHKFIDYRRKNFLLYLRNNENYILELNEDNLDLNVKNHIIDNLNRHKLWLDVIDIKKNTLNISGLLQSNFPNDNIKIKLVNKNNKRYECSLLNYNQNERETISYLSTEWIYRYNFDFEIPLDEITESSLYFEVEFNDDNINFSYEPEVSFRLPASMSTSSIYLSKGNYLIYFKNNEFNITKNNYSLMLKLELSNLKKILKDKQMGYFSAISIRLIYIILYPFMHNKNIWLFNDRLSFADDNALALYDYSLKKEDKHRKYFVISDSSDDYHKLKNKYPNILKFGSLRHKILYLFADKLIYAFINEDYSNPFYSKANPQYKSLFSGLFSFDRYFLQHGVTLGDVSGSIKKYNTNLSLIVTSSNLEEESFKKSGYGYKNEVIQTLGLPRYDNLNNHTLKRQILFMPTWRSNLNYDECLFENSEFYNSIKDFIANQRLKRLLDDNGYELIFKPHPELYKYESLFESENITLSEEKYQKLFNESAILITDYSSVAFDFAYLKKPIIYYQKRDDYHYHKGYFDFETMGFGEVISDENTLINKIENYIDNDCIMEKEYEKRVKDFFKYHDNKNCLRVYSWINNDEKIIKEGT